MTEEVGYPGAVASAAAGITYRLLDYWSRTGFVKPSGPADGQGSPPAYFRRDVLKLALARQLVALGVSHDSLRASFKNLDGLPPGMLSRAVLIVDGSVVRLATAGGDAGTDGEQVLIDVEAVWDEVGLGLQQRSPD
ncbi:MAG TPA: MerR family transcriptional regulator [Mycobacteriales bacterium]|jgi:hypothetical protein|nr:MerR family transcriptional regulator [Mycobacteriales bacterium]